MYYRRKILLSLLEQFDNKLEKISLQKLLFLLARQQEQKSFHFVPYKYGCYSFQANADLRTLTKYSITSEMEKYWVKSDNKNYFEELKPKDQAAIRFIKSEFGKLSKDELIALTYRNYPYFAINSSIASDILSSQELAKVKKQKPIKSDQVLFTIGYEGISLEQYLNKLIINDVKVLCDVRKNALSMKYGFSKSQLQKACCGVGIEYLHFPEVGIKSDKRQQLNTQADYNKLFAFYRSDVLTNETVKQAELLHLLTTKKRIALTCFEANIHQCHRKHLANSIAQLNGSHYGIKHI
jgi:uncharacterized protein (DUF488 family)